MEARLENRGSIEKWRLDWKIEARLRNRASFVAEWQNEVSWSFQIESFWSGLPETLNDPIFPLFSAGASNFICHAISMLTVFALWKLIQDTFSWGI